MSWPKNPVDALALNSGTLPAQLTTVKTSGYTVATLPAGAAGMRAYVTDALASSFLTIVIGGGSVVTPVVHNGTNWIGG